MEQTHLKYVLLTNISQETSNTHNTNMNNESATHRPQYSLNTYNSHPLALTYENVLPEIRRKYRKVRLKCRACSLATSSIAILLLAMLQVVAGNRPPRFAIDGGQSEIVLRLKESPETAVGSHIYTLKGIDPDNDPLVFGKRPSHDSEVIRIENTDGNEANVYLAKELDRELQDEYSIVLTLTDNRYNDYNYVTQSFLLLVEDINDNAPIFLPYQSTIEIPENSDPGILTTLEATDEDEGAYGQVVYYLQELDGDNDIFSISTYQGKGVLRLMGALDYETKSLYQLRVLAVDRANQGPVNTGTATVLVKVVDVGDQPPEFVQVQAIARIPENADIGTRVLQVRAIDGDRGINNPIVYELDANELFDIDQQTGVIYTAQELDREDTSQQVNGAYILRITATEVPQFKTSATDETMRVKTEVTVIVTDINDEIPTFRQPIYRCEVNENSQSNTPLSFIDDDVQNFVEDHDIGNNGTFRLFLDPPNDLFEIVPAVAVNEANFMVRVKNAKAIDYEEIKEINFTLFAREIDEPTRWGSAHLQVYIRDQNDNFPEFTQAIYNTTIPENSELGTIVTRIEATDVDSGDFGTMGIRFLNLRGGIAHLLHLNPITGIITIKQPGDSAFDREIISLHYITVEAIDNVGIGNRNTAQIIINIEDVNDNAPIFLQRHYEAKLLENKADFETPLLLEARDNDLNGTENSQITYEIVEGLYRANFSVDPENGLLRPLHAFDYEELVENRRRIRRRTDNGVREIDLLVRARDSGIPMLSTVVPVLIYIEDVNDNPPIFQKNFYAKTIPEDLPGGSSILQVMAIDRDGSPPNNVVVYRIQMGASDKFIINSESGVISVAHGANLDPDLSEPKKHVYTLTVLALDGGLGNSQLMNSATVNITIKDVNNKPPVLGELPTIRVMENTAVGTLIFQVHAADLDESPIIRYRINRDNCEARNEEGSFIKLSEFDFVSAFDLDPIEGTLKLLKLLDREKVEYLKLAIRAEDLASVKGKQVVEAFLNIIIEDENDNNPKFKQPFYRKTITENSINGVLITNILAYDIDKNKTITYSLEGNPAIRNLVHIDPQTGEMVVANKIDHEQYQWLNLTVRATDSGVPSRSALVDVYVSVLDENDNNPYFIGGSKNYTISENAEIGTRIGTVQANDADSGDFGKITFLMDRISSQGKFSIDADTGVLTVADKLDREMKDFYMLVIEAWDNYQFGFLAGESRNAFKQIFISILDENDNAPEVFLPTNCVLITEYHELNEKIATIRGKDADDPNSPNGRLEFQITKGNKYDLFELHQIDDWTANIFARTPLRNKFGNHTITITTRDLGVPSNIVTKTLDICISDFNDHPPVFVTPLHNTTLRIPENTTVGTQLLQVVATDEDIGMNALVRYRLKPDPLGSYKIFEIDSETGQLFLKENLSREKQKIHEIRIEAYDQGLPTSLSADLDLTIYIRNVNEYEPQFVVEEIHVNFTEHADPGSERVKLPDTIDKDEVDDLDDPPSLICYFIVKGNELGYFKLHPETHILSVEKELDREVIANYSLYVRATENCANDEFSANRRLDNFVEHNDQTHVLTNIGRKQAGFLRNTEYFNRYKHSRNLRSTNDVEAEAENDNGSYELSNENSNPTSEELLLFDSTVVRVRVRILDINDNPPHFRTKVFTGGITTSADFGTHFMRVEAVDPDEGVNAQISYYIIGDIRQTLSEGLENVKKAPFLVDRETGDVQLNFDPQKGMKGYFDFMVLANDTLGMKDVAHVFIYLLREDQKVKFVFRLQPDELRLKINAFRDTLSNVTGAIVNIDEIKVHENKDGSVDKTKTDLYMHLIEREDNSIYEVPEVLKLIDLHIEHLDDLFKELNVLDTQAAEAELLIAGPPKPMFVWLIFTNLFLATLLVVTLALCASQRKGYKRQLRAAKVNIFRNSSLSLHNNTEPATRVPNTNKHSVQGSNPIWLKGYENEWFRTDENLSQGGQDSLDDNFLAIGTQDIHETLKGTAKLFNHTNDLNRHFNVYNQIDKLTNNAQILARKLETTEL